TTVEWGKEYINLSQVSNQDWSGRTGAERALEALGPLVRKVNVSGGDPVIIENSDATYVEEAQAGSTFNLPDITHTDSDGAPVVLPAMVPMVCTPDASCLPASWTLRDSGNAVINSGSIPSGGSANIVAPDATWTLEDTGGNPLD